MKSFIEGIMPRFFPDVQFLCVKHEGKQDLDKSIPRKLRGWVEPGVRFIVVRDNDGGDCIALKKKLRSLCEEGKRPDALIRIACQELEAWYFGAPSALAAAFDDPKLAGIGSKEAFRDPDRITQPSRRLAELAPSFQKISSARVMAQLLAREGNASRSFCVFIDGVDRECKSLGGAATGGTAA